MYENSLRITPTDIYHLVRNHQTMKQGNYWGKVN